MSIVLYVNWYHVKSPTKGIQNVNKKENSKYCIKNHVRTRWNQEHCEQYTLSFDIEHIKNIQDKLNTFLYDMTITSENTIAIVYGN